MLTRHWMEENPMAKRSALQATGLGVIIAFGMGSDCTPPETKCDTALGCIDTYDTALWDTGDTGIDIQSPWIAGFEQDCDETAESTSYTVTVDGWANAISIDMIDSYSPAWEEYHELEEIDFESDGSGSTWYVSLDWTDNWEEQTDGVSTLYRNCTWPITFKVTSYDYGTGEEYDCIVTGDDTSLFDGSKCDTW